MVCSEVLGFFFSLPSTDCFSLCYTNEISGVQIGYASLHIINKSTSTQKSAASVTPWLKEIMKLGILSHAEPHFDYTPFLAHMLLWLSSYHSLIPWNQGCGAPFCTAHSVCTLCRPRSRMSQHERRICLLKLLKMSAGIIWESPPRLTSTSSTGKWGH